MTGAKRRQLAAIASVIGLVSMGGCSFGRDDEAPPSGAIAPSAADAMPVYDHVVVVILENKSRRQVLEDDGYLKALGDQGAELTRSHALTHPSQPNYIALFSGSMHGITDDSCPHRITGPQLAKQLERHGLTFKAFSESLPAVGARTCSGSDGKYRRKHAPWVNFASFDQRLHKPFGRFPDDFEKLPTVSFVIPNMCHDVHDCPLPDGNRWMRKRMDGYAQWAKAHDSLLVVTFDEDEGTKTNRIYTALVGARIVPGNYDQVVDHYSLLRTLENMYGLAALGGAASAEPIRGIWAG